MKISSGPDDKSLIERQSQMNLNYFNHLCQDPNLITTFLGKSYKYVKINPGNCFPCYMFVCLHVCVYLHVTGRQIFGWEMYPTKVWKDLPQVQREELVNQTLQHQDMVALRSELVVAPILPRLQETFINPFLSKLPVILQYYWQIMQIHPVGSQF